MGEGGREGVSEGVVSGESAASSPCVGCRGDVLR